MSPHLSPDAKAIVRAAEAMTEQVRRIADHLAAGARQDDFGLAPPATTPEQDAQSAVAALREQIADAIGSTNLPAWPRSYRLEAADAVLAVILPTTRLLGELARSADADIKRVTALYERWQKSSLLLGVTDMGRWWDQRLAELHAAILPPDQTDEDQGQAEPPTQDDHAPDQPDPRQPAYDAVYAYIRRRGNEMPTSKIQRNAMIWAAVNTALDATPVGRCISSHCVEGDHILPVDQTKEQ